MKISNNQIDFYIQKINNEKIAGCLVFGHDEASINYRFDMIAKKIVSDLSDPFLVAHITKDRLNQDKSLLHEEFYSFSMLGGRKLILIKDCDATTISSIKDIFEDSNFAKKSDNFILINGGDLDKGSAVRKLCEDSPYFAAIASYEDDDRVIKKFISDELLKYQIKANSQVTDLLFEKLGKNRQTIILEIEKIALFLDKEKNLTAEIVKILTAVEAEITANEFVMNFAAQKFDLALLQAQRLTGEGFEAITLIRFLSNYLQKIYSAKLDIESKKLNFEEAVAKQRLFFKVENEFRQHLKLFSLEKVVRNLLLLEKLEIEVKKYSSSPRLLFIAFIQDCLREKNA